jgi:hypothetical protein
LSLSVSRYSFESGFGSKEKDRTTSRKKKERKAREKRRPHKRRENNRSKQHGSDSAEKERDRQRGKIAMAFCLLLFLSVCFGLLVPSLPPSPLTSPQSLSLSWYFFFYPSHSVPPPFYICVCVFLAYFCARSHISFFISPDLSFFPSGPRPRPSRGRWWQPMVVGRASSRDHSPPCNLTPLPYLVRASP